MADGKKSSIGGKSTCHLLNIKEPARVAKRMKVAFQRANAAISLVKQGKTVEATMGLLDISETGAGFFTNMLLGKGSLIEINLHEPRPLKIKGRVAWSVPITSGIDKRRYPFRSGVQFLFDKEAERTSLKEYMESIAMDPAIVHQILVQEKEAADQAAAAAAANPPPAGEAPAAPVAVAEAAPAADATAPAPTAEAAPAAVEAPAAAPEASADETKKAA